MTVNNPITSYGIYQATIRDRTTLDQFQMLILDSVEPDLTQDLVDLRGGGASFPWASAPGEASGEIAMTIKQYDAGVLKYFSPWESGSITEQDTGEASGNVGDIENAVGTSVVSATTGIASIAADPAGTLKYGDYVAVAASATTIDLYVNTDIDDITFLSDALKITSTPITIPAEGATVVSSGIQFTGGSESTIAMVEGDKAKFSVRPVSSYYLQHQIGRIGAAPQEFELTIVGEKIGNKIRVAKYPKVIAGGGGGLKFPYKEWATFETTVKILQDPVVGYAGVEEIFNR